jgi:hypothetical protein
LNLTVVVMLNEYICSINQAEKLIINKLQIKQPWSFWIVYRMCVQIIYHERVHEVEKYFFI